MACSTSRWLVSSNSASSALSKRRDIAIGVAFIAGPNVEQDIIVMPRHSPLEQFADPPLRPHFRARSDEQLGVGIRGDDGADVAAVENCPTLLGREVPLALKQCVPDGRIGRDPGGDARHRLASKLLVAGVEAEVVARPKRLELVRRIASPAPELQGDGAIEQPCVHVRQAVMSSERTSDRALAAGRGPVDGDYEPLAPRHVRSEIPVQARRFDRGDSLWQGAPPNAAS